MIVLLLKNAALRILTYTALFSFFLELCYFNQNFRQHIDIIYIYLYISVTFYHILYIHIKNIPKNKRIS